MATTTMQQESVVSFGAGLACKIEDQEIPPLVPPFLQSAQLLGCADQTEVLEFLSGRPIHTVFMASLISDNGLVSPLNRGSFFGCRNENGRLEGVALIGHATLMETESEECIQAFAQVARDYPPAHLIRGEQQKVKSFWGHYAASNRAPRLLCSEHLLEHDSGPANFLAVPGLRQATLADLEQIVTINASMAFAESCTNPLTRDPKGFRERSARRINQDRNWVWIENGRVIFKADIIAETSDVIYLEGIYIDPEQRGKGYGLRCVSQLTHLLLARASTISLTVNEKFSDLQAFYRKAGYKVFSRYDTIYLH